MDEIMTRIADALERVEAIKTEEENNSQRYQALRKDLAKQIEDALKVRPGFNLDPKIVANHVLPSLLAGLPDTGQIQAAGEDIISRIQAERERIPTKISIQGEFWGFTSWKPLVLYSSLLFLCGGLCTYFWYEKKETIQYKENLELSKQRKFYYEQIESFVVKYPKYGNTFFPSYDDGGFWGKRRILTPPQN